MNVYNEFKEIAEVNARRDELIKQLESRFNGELKGILWHTAKFVRIPKIDTPHA